MQIARAHAALAARDKGEHAQFEIHGSARNELAQLGIAEDRALFSHRAHLGYTHGCDGVVFDEFVGKSAAEQSAKHAVNVRHGGSLAALSNRLVDDAANMGRTHVAQREPADRGKAIELEIAALLSHHADAERLASREPCLAVVAHAGRKGRGFDL